MIVHQHVGMDRQAIMPGCVFQAFHIVLAVVIMEKDGLLVITAMNNALGLTFDEITGQAGQGILLRMV
jgi:hypothetical protein